MHLCAEAGIIVTEYDEALSTPGHTNDSATQLLESGKAFAGDLRAPFLVDDPMSTESKSQTLLKNKNARLIYPGHGGVYEL